MLGSKSVCLGRGGTASADPKQTPHTCQDARELLYFPCSVNKIEICGLLAHTGGIFCMASSLHLIWRRFLLESLPSRASKLVLGHPGFCTPAFSNAPLELCGICLWRHCCSQFLFKQLHITFRSSHVGRDPWKCSSRVPLRNKWGWAEGRGLGSPVSLFS